ncbi:MAG: tetratricopeptide repeat protein [Armatimonadetes bacterium]|nr:tetratricopeptide repeat protein [Armatimonadota bacterium]
MRRFLYVSAYVLGLASCVSAAPVVVEDVPSINWGSGMASHYEAALYSILTALGCPVRYDELMIASGSAFRTAWWPGHYGYYSRTVAPDDLLALGAEAFGAIATTQAFKSDEEAWPAICRSIDEGRPVILCHASAADVICGYDADQHQMILQVYDTSEPGTQTRPFKLLEGRTWRPREVIFVEYEGGGKPVELDWPTILARAVTYADWPPEQTLLKGHVFGLGAYDAWAQTLRGGLDPQDPKVSAKFTYTYALVIQDAREAASVVLKDNATLHESFAEAAEHYMREAEILATMRNTLAGGMAGGWQEVSETIDRRFPEPAIREAAAQVVEQAKAEEVLAVDALREALADLAPQAAPLKPPETTGAQPANPGEADYQRGLELKRAGKFAEAAEALKAAITADPKHVEAHWTLGWVLIELKDREGAAAEFRKVIELAPGTERATEAQKALERLK